MHLTLVEKRTGGANDSEHIRPSLGRAAHSVDSTGLQLVGNGTRVVEVPDGVE